MPERVAPVWNCRESRKACAQLDALADDPRFDQVWIAVRWLIIRNPMEAGRPVPGKEHTYVLKTEDFMALGSPIMLVTYSIVNEATRVCEIVSILNVPAAENNAFISSPSPGPASSKPKSASPSV